MTHQKPQHRRGDVSRIQIDGVPYVCLTDLLAELGLSRQTLWRWRQEGKIPLGHRYRDRQVLFNPQEADQIRRFASRLEPIGQLGTK